MTKQQRTRQLHRRTAAVGIAAAAIITSVNIIPAFAGLTQETADLVEPIEPIRIQPDIIIESDPLPQITLRLETPEPLRAGLSLTAAEETALQKIALAEAEDQGTKGMALVMRVVLNRVNSSAWPNTVEGVIKQKGQFTPVSNGRYNKMTPNAASREALDWIESGWDESQGAQYFCMAGSSKWHSTHLTCLFQYKDHVFYK